VEVDLLVLIVIFKDVLSTLYIMTTRLIVIGEESLLKWPYLIDLVVTDRLLKHQINIGIHYVSVTCKVIKYIYSNKYSNSVENLLS
jgi:hypothetical protein